MSPRIAARDRLSLALQVISLAMDQEGISVDDAAEQVGVPPSVVEEAVRPFTDLEYVHTSGRLLDDIGNMVTIDDGQIEVHAHWMQDLAALSPGDAALLLAMIDTAEAIDGVPVEALRGLRRRLDAIVSVSVGEPVPAAVADLLTAKHRGKVISARLEGPDMRVAAPELYEVHEVRWSDTGWRALMSTYGGLFDVDMNVPAEKLHDIEITDRSFERRSLRLPDVPETSRMETVEIRHDRSAAWIVGYFDPLISSEDDEQVVSRIQIDVGTPLSRLLLRLGPRASVVSPPHLVDAGQVAADRVVSLYR